jgi:hypothetical protein
MRGVRLLRWAGLSGVLLALLAMTLFVGAFMSNSSAQGSSSTEESSPEADVPQQLTQATGDVGTTKGNEGDTEYILTAGGREIELDAGPPWYHGEPYPLAPFVGKSVTVTGEGGTNWKGKPEIDVFGITSDDGQSTEIRSAGKPPWAGGPKVVGERHPGFGKGNS